MIERYSIKFGPALNQKQLEKALHEDAKPDAIPGLHKMKARIEIICDFEDLKSLTEILKSLEKKEPR